MLLMNFTDLRNRYLTLEIIIDCWPLCTEMVLWSSTSSAVQLFLFQEREEEEAEKREREYVEQMVAERLASLEGGDTLNLQQNLDFMMNGKPQEENVASVENKL